MTPAQVRLFLVYLLVVNFISIIVCVFDKSAAKRKRHRVPEKTLFLLSVIGGSVGMLITMKIIRHKTLHKRFMIGIPLIIILQIAAVLAILYLT